MLVPAYPRPVPLPGTSSAQASEGSPNSHTGSQHRNAQSGPGAARAPPWPDVALRGAEFSNHSGLAASIAIPDLRPFDSPWPFDAHAGLPCRSLIAYSVTAALWPAVLACLAGPLAEPLAAVPPGPPGLLCPEGAAGHGGHRMHDVNAGPDPVPSHGPARPANLRTGAWRGPGAGRFTPAPPLHQQAPPSLCSKLPVASGRQAWAGLRPRGAMGWP